MPPNPDSELARLMATLPQVGEVERIGSPRIGDQAVAS